ncbi:hypothetical protein HIM_04588 [Hirsutella minnesotensis 3608]|uniref:Uncharacterized protein n=1 Tax=Hirsutella minnesotensis 3608 TaxID=1043627 RepID=A0A0F8A1D7_9HYPO|nr:hypothetical protein HIM_04588 [Hirsutella minnesotensis 3608]
MFSLAASAGLDLIGLGVTKRKRQAQLPKDGSAAMRAVGACRRLIKMDQWAPRFGRRGTSIALRFWCAATPTGSAQARRASASRYRFSNAVSTGPPPPRLSIAGGSDNSASFSVHKILDPDGCFAHPECSLLWCAGPTLMTPRAPPSLPPLPLPPP